jgi:hypothetical protein
MSIGPLPIVGVAAGTSLAQSKGPQIERAGHEVADYERKVETDGKAATAAGIGATEGEENQTSDRDADGRRLWQIPASQRQPPANAAVEQVADPTAESGTQLDLAG